MPTTMAKYLNPVPRWGGVIAHVLHDTKNWHIDFLKHGNALPHDPKGCFLRSGHDDSAIEGHSLAKGKLRIACARGQIHQQEVQFAPIDSADELLNRFHDHRSSPDHRLIAVQQETHAH